MTAVTLQYSRSKVKAAGKVLRDHYAAARATDKARIDSAIEVMDHWRACHSYPLQKATMGLRSRCRTAGCEDARVSQRLKRRPTVIDKLVRQPNMQLTTMHDIAGCRAVLASLDEVRRVQRRWAKTRDRVVRTYDYIAEPKVTGYRGVHLVVQYDTYFVEVQLRTQLQHAWGVAVERVGPAIGHDLKSGEGPDDVLDLFRYFGDLLAAADQQDYADFDAPGFHAVVDRVSPTVLRMVGLEVTADEIRLVLPDDM